jgi:hypothetical protein
VTAHPEVLVQRRDQLVADAAGVHAHRRPHKSLREACTSSPSWSAGATCRRTRPVGWRETSPASAENLQANVEAWVERLKQKRYRAQLMRRGDLPKGNGQERP